MQNRKQTFVACLILLVVYFIGFLTGHDINTHHQDYKSQCAYSIVQNPESNTPVPACSHLSFDEQREIMNNLIKFADSDNTGY